MDLKEKQERLNILREILKDDYGINSYTELLEAIQNTMPIDISVFTSTPIRKEESA